MGQKRDLAGARILITGASQGIGRALALAAARCGMKVIAAARSGKLLQELAEECRGQGHILQIVQADVTSAEDRGQMAEACWQHFGGLDILVNNAGIGATGHFADADPDRLRKIMEVNFFGLTETTRVLLPILKQGTKPAIVNISSIAGKRGIPARSDYSASKFAVQGFSESLRAELAKDGVDVLVVCPGLTQTNFSRNMLEQKALVPLDHLRGMTSEDVAEEILRSIRTGKNEVCLTLKGKLLVLASRFFPRLVDMLTKRKVRALSRNALARK